MNDFGSSYQIQYQQGRKVTPGSYTTHVNFPLKQNPQLSLKAEPDTQYTTYQHYLSISSSNRDSTNYPLHYDYRINFDFPYRNIKEIELISAILPNQGASSSSGDILNESHLVLDIDELNYIEFPNNVGSSALKACAIIPLKAGTKASGGFINPELGCIYHQSKVYRTPLASLDHLTIKIRDNLGNLYDFGQPTGSTAKAYQNHFVFKITTEEVKQTALNHRNVF